MSILQAALAAIVAIHGGAIHGGPIHGANLRGIAAQVAVADSSGPLLARTIKTDLEAIAGTGSVNVSVDGETQLITARVAIPGFNARIYTQIYDRELELRQLFPDLKFDLYFDGPQLAHAIQTELESIAGRGTVDVTVDSKTLFVVRIAMGGASSETYGRIFDRELDLYRIFRDLSFDFYLQPKITDAAQAR